MATYYRQAYYDTEPVCQNVVSVSYDSVVQSAILSTMTCSYLATYPVVAQTI